MASRDAKDKESVRNSNSKIRVLQPSFSKMSARQPSTKPERHIRTVASMSINESTSYGQPIPYAQTAMYDRAASAPVPVEAGELTYAIDVQVTWAIDAE